ncbi:MAG: hypothetical protein EXS55_02825 [Candidatus Magasanikbacteria bacterium]|nr:hypothetical protein [Candidatus Magasanikbacteria bacterium]
MKPLLKKIIIVAAILVGAGIVFVLANVAREAWLDYQWQKKTDTFMNALQKPFQEDTYGGKTPEETWALYVDAIKKRDIDLASKYVDVEHQPKELNDLRRSMESNKLDLYADSLMKNPLQKDTTTPDWLATNKERAYYFYKWKDPKTGKVNIVPENFYLNPLTNVWKILY